MSVSGSEPEKTLASVLMGRLDGGGASAAPALAAPLRRRRVPVFLTDAERRDAQAIVARFVVVCSLWGLALGAAAGWAADAFAAVKPSAGTVIVDIAIATCAWTFGGMAAGWLVFLRGCRVGETALRRAALLAVLIAPLVSTLLYLPFEVPQMLAAAQSGPIELARQYSPLRLVLQACAMAALNLPLFLLLLPLQYTLRARALRDFPGGNDPFSVHPGDIEQHAAFDRRASAGFALAAAAVSLPVVLSPQLVAQVSPDLATPFMRLGLMLPSSALAGFIAWWLSCWLGSRIVGPSAMPWLAGIGAVALLPALLIAELALWGGALAAGNDIAYTARLSLLPTDVYRMAVIGFDVGRDFIAHASFWLFTAIAPLVIAAHLLGWRAMRREREAG